MPAVPILDQSSTKQNFSVAVDAAGQNMARVTLDDTLPTYRYSGSFTPFGTADRTVISIVGSATKTRRVKRILVMGTGTAAGSSLWEMNRTSALGTGGTAVNPTATLLDKNFPAVSAAAAVAHYTTAAQTRGTVVGLLSTWTQNVSIVTLPTTGPVGWTPVFPEYGSAAGSALVLRGVADFIEIGNVAGNVTSGAIIQYMIEIIEDAS